MTKTLSVAVLSVLALALGGCGSSGDDAKASKAISDSILKQSTGSGSSAFFSMNRKSADCIGKGLVDKIGTSKLQKYGLVTKDLKTGKSVSGLQMKSADAASATDVLFGCTDMSSMMHSAIAKSGSVPKQMQTCIDKTLTEKNLRPIFVQIFEGQQAQATKSLTGPMTKCATGNGG